MNTVINPEFNQFSTGVFARAAQDQQLKPRETRKLLEAVDKMQSLSAFDKAMVMEFIQSLGNQTTQPNNLFNPRRNLSATDMAVLQAVAQDNPLTQQLLDQFQLAADPNQSDDASTVRDDLQRSEINPRQVQFPPTDSAVSDPNRPLTTEEFAYSRPSWYVNQYNTGLESRDGDCGPSSAAMVARSFGFQTELSERDVVDMARDKSGGPQEQSPWAIGIDHLSNAVDGMTGGQVTETSRKEFREGQAQDLMSSIQASLDRGERPVLLTAQSQEGIQSSRHYTVILGPDPRNPGNFLIADPAIAFQKLPDFQDNPLLEQPGNNNPSERQLFVRSVGPEELTSALAETEHTNNEGTFLIGYSANSQ